jgi:hypothetical protein
MSNCYHCGKSITTGGMCTTGDPYGDGHKVLGWPKREARVYCWDCIEYPKKMTKEIADKIDAEFKQLGLCGFLEAWVGRCTNTIPCNKHKDQKCWKCGEPATSNCSHASSLVCGMPECKKHPHKHGVMNHG